MVLVPKLAINRTSATPVAYLANGSDPGLGHRAGSRPVSTIRPGPTGLFGVGYETGNAGARRLIQTTVPVGSYSVYTRTRFDLADSRSSAASISARTTTTASSPGSTVSRSTARPRCLPGPLDWNTNVNLHESSNGQIAQLQPAARRLLRRAGRPRRRARTCSPSACGTAAPHSSNDLVVVPRLSVDGASVDNCPNAYNPEQTRHRRRRRGRRLRSRRRQRPAGRRDRQLPSCPNPGQEDADDDDIGDVCDNCPAGIRTSSRMDLDSDGAGDACDPCPLDPGNDVDGDLVCGDADNCPVDAEQRPGGCPTATALGDACDNCPARCQPGPGRPRLRRPGRQLRHLPGRSRQRRRQRRPLRATWTTARSTPTPTRTTTTRTARATTATACPPDPERLEHAARHSRPAAGQGRVHPVELDRAASAATYDVAGGTLADLEHRRRSRGRGLPRG